MAEPETIPWKPAPTFDDADDKELLSGEQEPMRTRKPRSDRGVPRGPRSERSPRRSRGSLKDGIGGMLVMFNLPVQMFAPAMMLDQAELEALAVTIDEQCKVSPTFRKYVERMLGVASGGQLVAVAGMVAGRRAARIGFFGANGETVDKAIGQQLQSMTGKEANTPEYAKRTEPQEKPVMPTETEGTQIGGIPPVGAPVS